MEFVPGGFGRTAALLHIKADAEEDMRATDSRVAGALTAAVAIAASATLAAAQACDQPGTEPRTHQHHASCHCLGLT